MAERGNDPLFDPYADPRHPLYRGPTITIDSAYELVAAAAKVILRWDADDVDAGAMDRDIERLRDAMREAGRGLTIRPDDPEVSE